MPEARQARRAAHAPTSLADEVPKALLALVEDHSRRTVKYLNEAVQAGRDHAGRVHEWRRLVLYALTDAIAHNYLLVGTLTAYLQQEGIDDDLIRRYLQSPDPDRYVTQDALDHLAGLMHQPVPDGQTEPVWHYIGRRIAEQAGDR
ncbi:hypothetical protein ABZV41_34825 [Streptomyces sp. NPDC005098]|uniref:hypothetical protein n=1 Tax=Streptomyces sp. NPDC005098 TaxID=3154560 RepID=UPI0033ADC196